MDSTIKLRMGVENWKDIKFNQYDKGKWLRFELLQSDGTPYIISDTDNVTAEWRMTNYQAIIQTKIDEIKQTTGSNIIEVLLDRRITRKEGNGRFSIAVTNSEDTTRESTFVNPYKVMQGAISEIVDTEDSDLALIEKLNDSIVKAVFKTEEAREVEGSLDAKITTARNTYEKLEQDINYADDVTDELKDTCNRAETDKVILEPLIQRAETDTPLLKEQVDRATPILTDLTNKNSESQTILTDLTNANNTATTNINDLTTQNTNANTNIDSLTDLNNNANSNITNLTTQNSNATTNIANLNSANSTAQQTLTDLQEAIINGDINSIINITNESFKTSLLDFCYPLNAEVLTRANSNPQTYYGGTWVSAGTLTNSDGIIYLWRRTN